jgi:hypothetical protein
LASSECTVARTGALDTGTAARQLAVFRAFPAAIYNLPLCTDADPRYRHDQWRHTSVSVNPGDAVKTGHIAVKQLDAAESSA